MTGEAARARPSSRSIAALAPVVGVGSFVAGYRIEEPLGEGGMGRVYRAVDPTLGREVALKLLPPERLADPQRLERFRHEARVIARLEHPNILPLYGFGIDRRTPWMAMRMLRGGHLGTRLRQGGMPPEELLRVLAAVARALDHAHANNVAHCDLKPENILLGDNGDVCLADFGVATATRGVREAPGESGLTGTAAYMAPEQALRQHVGGRADIYALGVIAYEGLAGQLPFTRRYAIDVLLAHVEAEVPLEPLHRAGHEPRVAEVLLRALAKRPDERWASAGGFVDQLADALGLAPRSELDLQFGAQRRGLLANALRLGRRLRRALRARRYTITAPRPVAERAVPQRAPEQGARRRNLVTIGAFVAMVGGMAIMAKALVDTHDKPRVIVAVQPAAATAPERTATTTATDTGDQGLAAGWRAPADAPSLSETFTSSHQDAQPDPSRWAVSSPDAARRVRQAGGLLYLTLAERSAGLYTALPAMHSGNSLRRLALRMRLDGQRVAGGEATAGLRLSLAGRPDWWVACYLVVSGVQRVTPTCRDSNGRSRAAAPVDARYFHVVAMAPDFAGGVMSLEANGRAFGELALPHAPGLASAHWQLALHGWAAPGSHATVALDDVTID